MKWNKRCDVGSARIRPPGGLDVGSRETVVVSRSFFVPCLHDRIGSVQAFDFDAGSITDFIERVKKALSEGGLADYVNVATDGGELIVDFRWMGSSQLRYRISEGVSGFRAELSGEKMSPLHAPFRQRFEDRFEKIIGAVGATVV